MEQSKTPASSVQVQIDEAVAAVVEETCRKLHNKHKPFPQNAADNIYRLQYNAGLTDAESVFHAIKPNYQQMLAERDYREWDRGYWEGVEAAALVLNSTETLGVENDKRFEITRAAIDKRDKRVKEEACAQQRELREAFGNLIRRMDIVHAASQHVFTLSALHGPEYTGPTYKKELEAARRSLEAKWK